ncbi:MAG: hypothetical protein O2913_13200 [Chloroflexi bacterium]|nr:hypothetical protein [Chloroflexota bacterium]
MKKEQRNDIGDSAETELVPVTDATVADWTVEPSGAPEEFGFQPDSTLSEKQRVWDRQEKFLAVYRTNGRLGKSAIAVGLTRWAPNGRQGRRPSIPAEMFDQVFAWHSQDIGERRISNLLGEMGIFASKSSVFRLLHGLPPYQERREANDA